MALYSACPLLGPVLGPVLASFINQALHWRWTWYICTMWAFAEFALLFIFVPETYAPVLLKQKARRLRKKTGNMQLRSQKELEEEATGVSKAQYIITSIGRPFGKLFFCAF